MHNNENSINWSYRLCGSAILKEALDRDHQVTAIARSPEKLSTVDDKVSPVKPDVTQVEELAEVLKGHDLVISAYNAGWTNPNIYNDFLQGAKLIQEGVKKSGVKRFIFIGGAGAFTQHQVSNWSIQPVFRRN